MIVDSTWQLLLAKACLVGSHELLPDGLVLCGPDCSSWGVPARSSSGRSYVNPYGRMSIQWVSGNNAIIARRLAVDPIEMPMLGCVAAGRISTPRN